MAPQNLDSRELEERTAAHAKFRRTVDILLTMKKMNSFLTACEEVLLWMQNYESTVVVCQLMKLFDLFHRRWYRPCLHLSCFLCIRSYFLFRNNVSKILGFFFEESTSSRLDLQPRFLDITEH